MDLNINVFQKNIKIKKMMEIDGNLSRLQSAMIVEKFNWNKKKCFAKMFFWFLLLTFVM